MSKPCVYFVISTHNEWFYTKKCLESLQKVKYKNYKIIIVNDGSTDDTSKNLKKFYPQIIELKGNGNLWDSGARNKAINYLLKKKFSPDYILSCNNDIIFDSRFLNYLINSACKKKNKVILGPKILYATNKKKVFQFGTSIDFKKGKLYLNNKEDNDSKKFNKNVLVDNLTGMCLFIPFSVFKNHKVYWDAKNFPMYYGDSDFILRAKKLGFESYVIGQSKVYAFTNHTASAKAKNWPFFKTLAFIFSPKSSWNPIRDFKFFYRHYGLKIGLRAFFRKSIWLLAFLKQKFFKNEQFI